MFAFGEVAPFGPLVLPLPVIVTGQMKWRERESKRGDFHVERRRKCVPVKEGEREEEGESSELGAEEKLRASVDLNQVASG